MPKKTKTGFSGGFTKIKYTMTNKTKAAIEEAAEQYATERNGRGYWHHKAGQKEVIEHPEKYGLVTREQYENDLQAVYNQGASEAVNYVNKNILK